jgi:hypothetical protein
MAHWGLLRQINNNNNNMTTHFNSCFDLLWLETMNWDKIKQLLSSVSPLSCYAQITVS